jgi:hypothetical protein
MSTTAVINTREVTDNAKSGVLKYVVLGTSVTPSHREFFSFPPAEISLEKTQLHDYHKSPNIVKGAAGLDAHGFRVVQHQSALSSDQWFTDSQAEDIYLPEAEALVKMLTGAKQTIVINASFRRKLATERHEKCYKRTGEGNLNLKALMREKPSGVCLLSLAIMTNIILYRERQPRRRARAFHISHSQCIRAGWRVYR